MTMLERGRLYWAELDKRRPVLVISSDLFNARSTYVTVIPGTTRFRPLATHLRLAKGDGGVGRPTTLLCEHVQELHQRDLDPTPLGPPLSPGLMRRVEDAILLFLDIVR